MAMRRGDGTKNNPYLVETAKDLDAVREDLSAHYKQTADMDLSEFPHWEPIGPVFQGTYDGDFHTIEHLTVLGSETGSLFHVLRGAVIRNLGLEHVALPETLECQSGLAHSSYQSIIENCYVTGHMEAADKASEVLLISHAAGDDEDWICRKRHPFYKEKALRSVKQQRKGTGVCRQNPCQGCPVGAMEAKLSELS